MAAEHAAYRAEAEAELAMLREERDELSRQAEAMAVELREMAELRRRCISLDLASLRPTSALGLGLG